MTATRPPGHTDAVSRSLAIVCALAIVGCGGPGDDPDASSSDAGVSDGGSRLVLDEPAPPMPPDIPWLADGAPPVEAPRMVCPSGWRERMDPSGVTVCEPWPSTGREVCTGAQAHFPGGAGCEAVGDACPSGGAFPTGLPSGRSLLYVLAGASGTGTEASPFGTLREALAVAPDDAIVVVGEGRYDESVELARGIALWGACAERVTLAPSTAGVGFDPVIGVTGRAEIRNVRVADADRVGVRVTGMGASATIRGLVIESAMTRGLLVDVEATADVAELVVRGTRAAPSGETGYGVTFAGGGPSTLARASLESNRCVGILLARASLTVSDTSITGTLRQESDGALGRGINVQEAATVDLHRVVVEDSFDFGIFVTGMAASVTGDDLVVRGTRATSVTPSGAGIGPQLGASVDLERVLLERNQSFGLTAVVSSQAILRDAVVLDTMPNEVTSIDGAGLGVGSRSTLTAERVWVARSVYGGVLAANVGTIVTLVDATILDTEWLEGSAVGGRGIWVETGVTLTLRRARVERNVEVGIFAQSSTVTLEDVRVADTLPRPTGELGEGIHVEGAAFATGARILVEGSRHVGIGVLHAFTEVELDDVVVRETVAQLSDGQEGYGVLVDEGGSLVVRRGLFERNTDVSVASRGVDSVLVLEDATIQDSRPRELDSTNGLGLGVVLGGSLRATRVALHGNREIGIYVHDPGTTAELSDLVVEDTAEGSLGAGLLGAGTGYGVLVGNAATLDGVRWRLSRNHSIGLVVRGIDTAVTATEVVIEDTQSYARELALGRAVSAVAGAQLSLTRARVSGSREVGVFAYGEGTDVTLAQIEVLDTDAAECERTDCPGRSGGIGVGSYESAHIAVSDFVIASSRLCGVQVAFAGLLDLVRGEVRDAPVGACVQVAGYDVSRLNQSVDWIEVGSVIEATELPIPHLPELPDLE